MGVSIDDLMAQISGDSSEEKKPAEVVKEEETPPEVSESKEEKTSIEDLIVGAEDVPEPEPVKKRGRPKSTAKKAPEEVKPEPSETTETETPEIVISSASISADSIADAAISDDMAQDTTIKESPLGESKDIYVLTDSQIINGHIYRRGQKISFRRGDKFYNSQTDRNGSNWLDYVDDPEAQYAYFGKLIVEPDQWTGIPLGSVEGINHPGLALAISKFAQEEYKRKGIPFN